MGWARGYSFLQLMQSCPSNGVAPHMASFFFVNEIFYLKYKTALIIETDTALDFERLSAVDIE